MVDPKLKAKINSVPLLAEVRVQWEQDSAEFLLIRPVSGWENRCGSVKEIFAHLVGLSGPEDRRSMIEFFDLVRDGANSTISPVSLMSREGNKYVGLAALSSEKRSSILSLLDLGEYISWTEEQEMRNNLYSTLMRMIEWSGSSQTRSAVESHLLGELINLTGSTIGFMGSRKIDESGRPFLVAHAISNIAWDDESRALYDRVGERKFEFRNLETLFGPTIERGEVVIENDYGSNSLGSGLPGGHPPLKNMMSLPVHLDNELVGMVCLGNRDFDFTLSEQQVCQAAISYLGTLPRPFNPFIDWSRQDSPGDETSNFGLSTILENLGVLENLEVPTLVLSGTIVSSASKQTGKILGCLPSLLVGTDLKEGSRAIGLDLLDKSEDADYQAYLGDAQLEDSGSHFVLVKKDRLGEKRYFRLSDIGGTPSATGKSVFILSEITSIISSVREKRKAKARSASARQLQSSIIQMISHELRTPLSSLQTAVEIIEMGNSSAQLTSHFETIYSSVQQMTTHMDSVLTLGRLTEEEAQMVLSEVNIKDALKEILRLMTDANRRRVEFICQMRDHGSSNIKADRSMLQVVVRNLLSNALKFSNENVELRLENPGEGSVLLRITDHGLGIPKKELKMILEPFNRASNVLSVPGTGIGLSIAKMMMDKMDATFKMNSEIDRGTQVTLGFQKAQI